jgi:hypothetical protein
MRRRFWKWLTLFSYRRWARDPEGRKPVGVPHNRDPEHPCESYAPRKRVAGDWSCQGDGHYLCEGCRHFVKCSCPTTCPCPLNTLGPKDPHCPIHMTHPWPADDCPIHDGPGSLNTFLTTRAAEEHDPELPSWGRGVRP